MRIKQIVRNHFNQFELQDFKLVVDNCWNMTLMNNDDRWFGLWMLVDRFHRSHIVSSIHI